MIPETKFKLKYTEEMLTRPCLVIGPGLEPMFWSKSLASALVTYDKMQQILFCEANDLQREHFGVPRGALRALIKALFDEQALIDPPYLDEIWQRLRESVEFRAAGSPLDGTVPAQWDPPDPTEDTGINDPRAPARIKRYARRMRRKGMYVDVKSVKVFHGPRQAVRILEEFVYFFGDGQVVTDEQLINTVKTLKLSERTLFNRQSPEVVYRYYRPWFLKQGSLKLVSLKGLR
jgi:hypothetical protein